MKLPQKRKSAKAVKAEKEKAAGNEINTAVNSFPEKTIEQEAYRLFLERGCTHGSALNDWLEAERIVKGKCL